ncbi:MAG: hypothetical protein RL417_1579 [Pseudomonadota bacterium]
MKRILSIVLAFFALSVAVPGSVAAEGPLVYVVDMQTLIDQSIVGKGARANLEADLKKRELALEKRRFELKKIQDDIQKQSGLLSPAALQEKREVFARNERDFARLLEDQRAEAAKKNDAEMARVIKEIDGVIAEIAAEGKHPFIVERNPRVVVYASSRIDITPQVLKVLNEKKIGM